MTDGKRTAKNDYSQIGFIEVGRSDIQELMEQLEPKMKGVQITEAEA